MFGIYYYVSSKYVYVNLSVIKAPVISLVPFELDISDRRYSLIMEIRLSQMNLLPAWEIRS